MKRENLNLYFAILQYISSSVASMESRAHLMLVTISGYYEKEIVQTDLLYIVNFAVVMSVFMTSLPCFFH